MCIPTTDQMQICYVVVLSFVFVADTPHVFFFKLELFDTFRGHDELKTAHAGNSSVNVILNTYRRTSGGKIRPVFQYFPLVISRRKIQIQTHCVLLSVSHTYICPACKKWIILLESFVSNRFCWWIIYTNHLYWSKMFVFVFIFYFQISTTYFETANIVVCPT